MLRRLLQWHFENQWIVTGSDMLNKICVVTMITKLYNFTARRHWRHVYEHYKFRYWFWFKIEYAKTNLPLLSGHGARPSFRGMFSVNNGSLHSIKIIKSTCCLVLIKYILTLYTMICINCIAPYGATLGRCVTSMYPETIEFIEQSTSSSSTTEKRKWLIHGVNK